jgi:7-cyano-7-deazaguanine reductase
MVMNLHALGSVVTQPTEPSITILETFSNPSIGNGTLDLKIGMEHDEFTCLCPKTGQPDFGKIEIHYSADQVCVESKSLKLYLGSYRNQKMFHEQIVVQIGSALATVLDPFNLTVIGHFNPRGGLFFNPTFYWERTD